MLTKHALPWGLIFNAQAGTFALVDTVDTGHSTKPIAWIDAYAP